LVWDQNLKNGTGDWVKLSLQENEDGFATVTANYPGFIILATK
jgi:hypothetical protein